MVTGDRLRYRIASEKPNPVRAARTPHRRSLTLKKFGTAWLLLTTIFFLTCYGIIWVADNFGFHAMADIFLGSGILGHVSMLLGLSPGVAALALAAWLRRHPLD